MAALHLNVAAQILSIHRTMRQRVWQAANIRLETVTLDTDTTVHTLYGNQMGARKSDDAGRRNTPAQNRQRDRNAHIAGQNHGPIERERGPSKGRIRSDR